MKEESGREILMLTEEDHSDSVVISCKENDNNVTFIPIKANIHSLKVGYLCFIFIIVFEKFYANA